MKILRFGAPILAGLLSVLTVRAQTADEIIAEHITAIGGNDLLAQAKTLYTEGTVQVMGNDNPATTTILNGVGFRSESEFNGSKFIQVYTDKAGWMINPMAGGNPEQMPEEQYNSGRNQIFIGDPLCNHITLGNSVELIGKELNLYKLKVTSPDKTESTYYVDPTTYYISKVIKKGMMQGQEVEITITYSDYRKTDFGLVMPFSTGMDFGGNFALTTTLNKIEFNRAVDPSIFDYPK